MLANPAQFNGKTYQKVVMYGEEEDGTRHLSQTREVACLGGLGSETRSRDGSGTLRIGKKGTMYSLDAGLPHQEARYDLVDRYADPASGVMASRATRRDDGTIEFVLSGLGGDDVGYAVVCDPKFSYLPIEITIRTTPVDELGSGQRYEAIKTVQCTYDNVSHSSGREVFYPVSGEVKYRVGDHEAVTIVSWKVDRDSVRVNENIPDATFVLQPTPEETVLRDSDLKMLRAPLVRRSDMDPPAGAGTGEAILGKAPTDAADIYSEPEGYSAGRVGLFLGIATTLVGAGILIYRSAKG